MYRTDDPFADFQRHSAELEEWLKRRPTCGYCDEHIQDEYLYEINGECICYRCLIDNHRKPTEEYIG